MTEFGWSTHLNRLEPMSVFKNTRHSTHQGRGARLLLLDVLSKRYVLSTIITLQRETNSGFGQSVDKEFFKKQQKVSKLTFIGNLYSFFSAAGSAGSSTVSAALSRSSISPVSRSTFLPKRLQVRERGKRRPTRRCSDEPRRSAS